MYDFLSWFGVLVLIRFLYMNFSSCSCWDNLFCRYFKYVEINRWLFYCDLVANVSCSKGVILYWLIVIFDLLMDRLFKIFKNCSKGDFKYICYYVIYGLLEVKIFFVVVQFIQSFILVRKVIYIVVLFIGVIELIFIKKKKKKFFFVLLMIQRNCWLIKLWNWITLVVYLEEILNLYYFFVWC